MRDEARRPTPTYDAFISYNSADLEVVQRFAERLHERGFQVFLDDWCLVPGETWQEALIEALDSSPCCLVMCGPQGFGPWQNEEVRVAIEARVRGRTMRVVPVLLPGSADSAWRSVPFLGRFTYCDFRQGLEQTRVFERLCAGIRGEAPGPPFSVTPAVSKEPAQMDFRSRLNVMAGSWRRVSVVEAACRAVAADRTPVVLYGLPGVGKTTVLCDVADEIRSGRTVLALTVGGTATAEPRYLVDEVNTWLATTFDRGSLRRTCTGTNGRARLPSCCGKWPTNGSLYYWTTLSPARSRTRCCGPSRSSRSAWSWAPRAVISAPVMTSAMWSCPRCHEGRASSSSPMW